MTTALAHGVFDLFHSGHVEYLKQASRMADTLIVSVVPDKFVNKAVVYTERERLALIRGCKYVSLAALSEGPGPEKLLESLHPDLYIRNDEYFYQDRPEYDLVRRLGIEIRFTTTVPPHTTDIIKRVFKLPRSRLK